MTWKRRERIWYRCGHIFSTGFMSLFLRPKIKGREHIPKTGGVLIAPNHRSMLDIPTLGCATFRPLRFMAKKELFKYRIVKWYFETNGSFSVDNQGSDPRAVKKAVDILKSGDALVVFPEGKRNRQPAIGELAAGSGFLAVMSGVPVLPVGIAGIDKVIHWKFCIPVFRRAKLVIGEPITFHIGREGKSSETVNMLLVELSSRIQELYEEAIAL